MQGISGSEEGGSDAVKIDPDNQRESDEEGGKLRAYCRIHEPLASPLDTVAHCRRSLSLSLAHQHLGQGFFSLPFFCMD